MTTGRLEGDSAFVGYGHLMRLIGGGNTPIAIATSMERGAL